MIESYLRKTWGAVDDYFNQEESAWKLGLFRIAFGIVLMLNAILLLEFLLPGFTHDGFFSIAQAKQFVSGNAFSLFFWNDQPAFVVGCYVLLVAAITSFTLGYRPRVMAVIIWILLVSFDNRDMLLFHAGDMVVRFFLPFVACLDTGQALVLPMLAPKQGRKPKTKVAGWPVRIIQIQMALIYLFAGISKLRSDTWISGTYLASLLNFPGRVQFDFSWLLNQPVLAALADYGVIALEVSFIFLVFQKRTRVHAVVGAMLMHLAIWGTFNVIYFGEIMFCFLLLFLTEGELRNTLEYLVRKSKQVVRFVRA